MVGIDTTNPAELTHHVEGDASLTFEMATSEIDLALTEIVSREGGRSYPDITFDNISVQNGTFAAGPDSSNMVEGQFYGPNHEEVGGVFERNQILGAFGAKQP